jgi:uncharacterized FlaG/YvyC family protein
MFREEVDHILKYKEEISKKKEEQKNMEKAKNNDRQRKCDDLDDQTIEEIYAGIKTNIKNLLIYNKYEINEKTNKPIIYIPYPYPGPSEQIIREYLEKDGFTLCDRDESLPRGFNIEC